VSKREISSFIKLRLNYLSLILIYLFIALRKKYEFCPPVSGPSYVITGATCDVMKVALGLPKQRYENIRE